MICGTSSGSGKTMVTCGILQALVNRNMRVSAFKCGPDYIDPMFHTSVIGAKSCNIDTFFYTADTARQIMAETAENSDISVVEGVMGYYDGIANTTSASSYEVSRVTDTPAVLVINASGMGISAAAEAKGFSLFRGDNPIRGVILNRASQRAYPKLKEAIENECGLRVYGYLPKSADCAVESRHLGLVKPEEIENLRERLIRLAGIIEKNVDIDGLISLANSARELEFKERRIPGNGHGLKIAVARDEAFCFYYEDNINILKKAGCEIVEFSPLRDERLPEADGILLGGGYPELYAERLSKNKSMRASVKSAIERKIPCIAECGGFMYLHRVLRTEDKTEYNMCGVIDAEVYFTGRLGRFGYIELESGKKSLFGDSGTKIRGHEFHYFDSTDNGDSFAAVKPKSDVSWKCVHAEENLICGFPHYSFASNPEVVKSFLDACKGAGGK